MPKRQDIEKYSRVATLKQLLKELREIKEDLGGGINDKYIERDHTLQRRIDDFVKKKLRYYSLLTQNDPERTEELKISESSIRGKFDERGIYQPAKFEHLTSEKYYEYQEMNEERPMHWQNKLQSELALSAAEKKEMAQKKKEKLEKEALVKQTKVKIGIQDVEAMRERIRQRQYTLSSDHFKSMDSGKPYTSYEIDSPK